MKRKILKIRKKIFKKFSLKAGQEKTEFQKFTYILLLVDLLCKYVKDSHTTAVYPLNFLSLSCNAYACALSKAKQRMKSLTTEELFSPIEKNFEGGVYGVFSPRFKKSCEDCDFLYRFKYFKWTGHFQGFPYGGYDNVIIT